MEKNLTTGSVFRNIVGFSLPYLLAYFLQTLYGMADLFITGQFSGTADITAVSIGSQVMHMITVMIVGLAMGTTIAIGRAVGGREQEKAALAIGNSTTLFIGLSVVLTVILLALVRPIVGIMSTPEEAVEGTVRYLTICFIGIPFIDMFTDGNAEATMYMIVFSVAFNLILWTLGAYLMTQDRKQISLKKAFLNPCTVGSVIGFLLFLVPQINIFDMEAVAELQQIVEYTGNMTAPLSMMVVGVRLAELPARSLFGDPKIYLCAFVRLILSAALTYLIILPFKLAGLFEATPYVLLTPVIAMAMPPAASVVAFAEKLDGEKQFSRTAERRLFLGPKERHSGRDFGNGRLLVGEQGDLVDDEKGEKDKENDEIVDGWEEGHGQDGEAEAEADGQEEKEERSQEGQPSVKGFSPHFSRAPVFLPQP